MIDRLQLDGFRGLDNLDIGPLARFNVVVGTAGSGKTALLEAAFLFCETGNPLGLVTALEQRGPAPLVGRSAADLADLLTWFASYGRDPRSCSLRGSWKGLDRQVTISRRPSSEPRAKRMRQETRWQWLCEKAHGWAVGTGFPC